MTRNVLIFMIFLLLPIMSACGNGARDFTQAKILPEDCRMTVRQEMPLTLDGWLPSKAIVRWTADQGEISFVVMSLDAVFVAPSEPTVVTISASITPALPGIKTPIKRQCIVTSLNTAPSGLAQANQFEVLFSNWLELPDDSHGLNAY